VVVADCLLLPAIKACATAGVPVVSLEHTFDAYVRGGWARGPVGLTARLKGFAPTRTWDAAALSLVASLPSLDPAYDGQQAGNRVWTGPFVERPAPRDRSGQPPKVLVSLSTFFYAGMVETLQRVLDGIGTVDVPAVVTTGPVIDPAQLRAPANVELHRYLSHDELMPEVSLVVGHGGHSTTMRALAHGLPLVVMPLHPLLDQPMVGRRVEESGAGRVLSRKARPHQVASAVQELLHDDSYRIAAQRIADEIRPTGGTDGAADLLEELAGRPSTQRLG
jgi:UDP:flavonoid glycosyltransferase YjiC (YdhE family)